ncbi:4-oxalocitramalate aldolase/oxaloacetate decarboxylase [Arcobacter venerupis]|uniref:4-hydroxy-4-methyl-2-oxoglutarate aldolase n=1 Tax=Arcobacter venerupis TaxID=1054033 RepID=A0AAE7BBU6_9BACT|nr:4-carboxy-4-hydroxy-2-oxoadipate aldolase/oxaloacetate decarboxylase [Arcobacter venerupis]QKF67695.1 4-oxalocitramalate aldolase/oxaloacetate decarboxylase [Arcobacter venerupis]RWS49149.1 4-carboxy-4-hydroxy-2-oxoadipate aldolase/oxaloacetate decarboxylase [Arcobacter venerupis]
MLREQVLGVAVKNINRAPQEQIDRLEKLGSATVHEAQKRVGQLKPYLRPVFSGVRIAGSAITVLLQPGDNWMLHVAMELAQPGDIIIAGCTTENDDGFFGDLLATSAIAQGVKGLVIDGGVRDTKDLKEMNFPVWSKAISIKGTVKNTLGSVNIPIICGGQQINPGDIVIADDDGICIVPYENAQIVADAAQKRESFEGEKRAKFEDGVLGLDLYNMRPGLEAAGFKYYDSLEDLKKGI